MRIHRNSHYRISFFDESECLSYRDVQTVFGQRRTARVNVISRPLWRARLFLFIEDDIFNERRTKNEKKNFINGACCFDVFVTFGFFVWL